MTALLIICVICAAVPCLLLLRNLSLYSTPPLPRTPGTVPSISVLIPARNEEGTISAAVGSALRNTDVDLEVIVLNDNSDDRTAEIVREIARTDSRVRLESAPPLPPGWCGKQHACAELAECARHPLLVFMDADVRLERSALARMAAFLSTGKAALASGVPRQELGSFAERLLIPLIHFVLLGFLPISRMRRSAEPAYAAGCGQLFIARADAYRATGGHRRIRATLHDGIQLPRSFRDHGYSTDLFDATDVAHCRMYRGAAQTFGGLAKNASEGLGAPKRIVPITALLLLGQVIPFLVILLPGLGYVERTLAAVAVGASYVSRLAACRRFRQPVSSALLHPFGIVALLGIQWVALMRLLRGRPSVWRGRAYPQAAAGLAALLSILHATAAQTNQEMRIPSFTLNDQHERAHRFEIPRTNLTFIAVADHKGSDQLEAWIKPVYERHRNDVAIVGVADVGRVPTGFKGMVKRAFVKELSYPVLLDWSGKVTKSFNPKANVANIYLVEADGDVAATWSGAVSSSKLDELANAIRTAKGSANHLPQNETAPGNGSRLRKN